VFGVSGWEIVILAILALVVFGPDRLPGVISDAARMLRQLRRMAQDARNEMADVMPELDELRDLDPRTFVRRQLLDEADDLRDSIEGDPTPPNGATKPPRRTTGATDSAPSAVPLPPAAPSAPLPAAPPAAPTADTSAWDADAT